MTKPRPTPGQVDLTGSVQPDEVPNRMLLDHGFKGWRDQGSMRYTDPFRPTVHLDARAAKKLLRERMDVVGYSGFRVRYPQTHYSEVRIGQRRATQEGAWHELHKACAIKPPPVGWWIIDGATNQRVWPPVDEQRARAISIDDDADSDD